MSFFYLFIPTWIFTIVVYTFLAGRYGAKIKYPEAEEKERLRNINISKFQEQKAEGEQIIIKDTTLFTKILRGISLLVLLITVVLACIVLFGSEDAEMYTQNREVFYKYAFICTVIYFVTAYWALQRGKIKNT